MTFQGWPMITETPQVKISIRPWQPTDNVVELTALLNGAYQKLADQGFRFLASYQDAETTRRRLKKGECLVAVMDGKLVGTITFYPEEKGRHFWYKHPMVSKFGQFAVAPALQSAGVGGMLLDFVEDRARRNGFSELALDTAEKAVGLVAWYTKRGYRFIDFVQWTNANYRSVILSKRLDA